MHASAQNSLEIRVVESDNDFASLRADWDRLQAEASPTSIFAGFDWMYLWWKTYGRKNAPRIPTEPIGYKKT